MTMDLKKVMGVLVIVLVLFWIITQPSSASSSVNDLMGNLEEVGDSMVTFLSNVF